MKVFRFNNEYYTLKIKERVYFPQFNQMFRYTYSKKRPCESIKSSSMKQYYQYGFYVAGQVGGELITIKLDDPFVFEII